MAKPKSTYACQECGATRPSWSGQCPECGQWNTMHETLESPAARQAKSGARAANWSGSRSDQVRTLTQVGQGQAPHRMGTGNSELDRVLGGGLVVGSVVLLGGDPGIGKSTLLLQALAGMGEKGRKTLYVTGEESLDQVAQRALRLGLGTDHVHALAETDVETILATAEAEVPQVMVIDSIQTLQSLGLASAPGTVSQVRESAAQLTRYAKTRNCAVFLVGHVTKSGELAGPRVLEHMVDAVLYFEGDPSSPFRLIRAMKNRFGPVNELGAFEMGEEGLASVDNPSAMFLSADREAAVGSNVFVMQEGPRALLIEIQALVDDASQNPRRLAVGVDANRLAMLLGVIHKHASMETGGLDVFVNAVGGIRATEPAADLPMCLAILSSLRDKPWDVGLASFGEIGLTGELRPVQHAEDRIREAAKLGFKRILLPQRNLPRKPISGIELIPAKTLVEAMGRVSGY